MAVLWPGCMCPYLEVFDLIFWWMFLVQLYIILSLICPEWRYILLHQLQILIHSLQHLHLILVMVQHHFAAIVTVDLSIGDVVGDMLHLVKVLVMVAIPSIVLTIRGQTISMRCDRNILVLLLLYIRILWWLHWILHLHLKLVLHLFRSFLLLMSTPLFAICFLGLLVILSK